MDPIEHAKEELVQSAARLLSLVDETPDDRLFWKPSPTARSIGEIVAHCAHAMNNIAPQMMGTPYAIATSSEANRTFLEHDRQFSDRANVVRYFEEARNGFIGHLDRFSLDEVDRLVTMPFGMGQAPVRLFMEAASNHTKGHIAQIEYIQTLYGDHDWHYGF
mgnify:CR=1 FL=1